MVKKVYGSPHKVISMMAVMVDGIFRTINFTPTTRFAKIGTDNGSMFETCDEKMQAALESHRLFNRNFFLIDEQRIEEEPEEVAAAPKEFVHVPVSTPAEARDYIVTNYGVKAREIWSKENLFKKAEELGIVFEGI